MKGQLSEDIVDKCGGRFKLSVLLQKRMREYFLSYSRVTAAPTLARAMSECASGEIWLEKPKPLVAVEEEASAEEDEASADAS